jgi:hypothetical protein
MNKFSKFAISLLFPFLLSSPTKLYDLNPNYFNVDYSHFPVDYSYDLKTGVLGNRLRLPSGTITKRGNGSLKSLEVSVLFNRVNYSFNKPNDSTYIEKLSIPSEIYIYKKRNDSWVLTNYVAEGKERDYKRDLVNNSYDGKTLADITSEHLNVIGDTINFFLFGENYNILRSSHDRVEILGIVKRDGDEGVFSNDVKLFQGKSSLYPESFELKFEVENRGLLNGNYTLRGSFKK